MLSSILVKLNKHVFDITCNTKNERKYKM